jgi:hypothetical protein
MTCPNANSSSTFSKIARMLHFLEDHEDPWGIVNMFKHQVAPGSFLVISHVTADHLPPGAARRAREAYAGVSAPGVARTGQEIARFFGGLDMISPALTVPKRRPGHLSPARGPAVFYAGIGCKSSGGRSR